MSNQQQHPIVRMVGVSPLLWGPGNIHGFVLGGKSYRPELAIAQTLTVAAVSGVRKTTLMYRE